MQGWTLLQLSEKSGIPVSNLSKIEIGKASPALLTTMRISEALGIPLVRFIEPLEQAESSGRRAMTKAGNGEVYEDGRYTVELLCGDMVSRHNVFWKMHVKARSLAAFGAFSVHPGEEFLYVLSGQLVLHTQTYRPARLGAGDSIFFDSMTPHAYVAGTDEACYALMSNRLANGLASGSRPRDAGDTDIERPVAPEGTVERLVVIATAARSDPNHPPVPAGERRRKLRGAESGPPTQASSRETR